MRWLNLNKISLKHVPWCLTDDKWTLVEVIAWCIQATSHHLIWCWLKSVTPYKMAETLILTLITDRSDLEVSNQCLIHGDPMVFVILGFDVTSPGWHWRVNKNTVLVEIMAWHQGNKPLSKQICYKSWFGTWSKKVASKSIMIQFTDASMYMHHGYMYVNVCEKEFGSSQLIWTWCHKGSHKVLTWRTNTIIISSHNSHWKTWLSVWN